MARLIYTYVDPPSERDLIEAVRVLREDGLLAYPTDVNWGFGASARSPKALARLFRLKPGHPSDKPLTLLCDSIAMMATVAEIGAPEYRLLRRALPGPFTFLLPRLKGLPKLIHDKRPVVGVRVPQSPLLLALIERLGGPLVNTSVPSTTEQSGDCHYGYQVEAQFGHALDLILDLGEELVSRETTVVDLTAGSPQIVRQGLGDSAMLGLSVDNP